MKNAVVYYSNTGQSKAVADYLAGRLGYPLADLQESGEVQYENLVLVFPVHCQNLPDCVKAFLKKAQVERLTAIATFGKMCCGNVLYEIQRHYQPSVIAGAYLPTKHSYIEADDAFCDYDALEPLIHKIRQPFSIVRLPKLYKNPFANLFPKLRSRLGVTLRKTADCNGCNLCRAACPLRAISSGVPDEKCIRCLKCVDACPRKALQVKIGWPLKLYLRRKKDNNFRIYV